jgi:hypothetical protein
VPFIYLDETYKVPPGSVQGVGRAPRDRCSVGLSSTVFERVCGAIFNLRVKVGERVDIAYPSA